MSASQSNLSSDKYGYDFVVATTQASINAGLKEYLNDVDQPTSYLCFLADELGNPTTEISLDDLTSRTDGVNPFDIPGGTDYNEQRIKTLTQNMFVVGLKLKLGLPATILPNQLPPIVDLGTSASNVTFNLLCSEFEVIQNSPPTGFGHRGSWNVWSQPSGQAWYFSTSVNLVLADLDQELDTAYFNSHPDKKQALLNQLRNLSGSAFALQQLLFDLDNAVVQSVPNISGLPAGSDAAVVLTKAFANLYFQSMKEHGEPVIAVHAVAHTPDHSSLRLTGMDHEIGRFVDGNGVPVPRPTPEQKQVVTLDYLCAANNNPLPGAATFSWNWVEPQDVTDESGVVAVNRTTMAKWLYSQMLPQIRSACIKPSTSVTAHALGRLDNSFGLAPGQTPQTVNYPDSGDTVLTVSYSHNADAHDKSGATYGELDVHSSYTCNVSFKGSTITIVQHLVMWVKAVFDLTETSGNVVDKTLTDTFTLSVDQNGDLQTSRKSSTQDNSQKIDLSWFVSLFVDMNRMIDKIQELADNVTNAALTDIPIGDIQNFVFPGADVFTYTSVQFSDHGDLLSAITYVRPG